MATAEYRALSMSLAAAINNAAAADDTSLSDAERQTAAKASAVAWATVPAGVRAALAAVKHVMAGRRNPSTVKMAETGGLSRGSYASNEAWKPLVAALANHADVLVEKLLGEVVDHERERALTSAVIQERDETIADLRRQLIQAHTAVAPLQRTVQELHAALEHERIRYEPTPLHAGAAYPGLTGVAPDHGPTRKA